MPGARAALLFVVASRPCHLYAFDKPLTLRAAAVRCSPPPNGPLVCRVSCSFEGWSSKPPSRGSPAISQEDAPCSVRWVPATPLLRAPCAHRGVLLVCVACSCPPLPLLCRLGGRTPTTPMPRCFVCLSTRYGRWINSRELVRTTTSLLARGQGAMGKGPRATLLISRCMRTLPRGAGLSPGSPDRPPHTTHHLIALRHNQIW